MMYGRSRELGRLRSLLDAREPALVRVTGIRGGGKSSLLRRVLQDYPSLFHVCPPLPDPDQRAALADGLRREGVEEAAGAAWLPEWDELLATVLMHAEEAGRPFVLVLDDAHRLFEARSRIRGPLLRLVGDAAARGIPLHVVLVGPEGTLPPEDGLREALPEGVVAATVDVGPLPFRSAAPMLPRTEPDQKIRAYGVFGGIPRVLRRLDPDVTVGTNVRRLLLSTDGLLADLGGAWLERDVQSPSRYYAVLHTLARGEADWGSVHEGVQDLTRSGQVAPYLNRLEELGLVVARRSVDASPRGRSRRYALTDPLFAFWLRFVLPYRLRHEAPEEAGARTYYARHVRPAIDDHMETVFPLVCRQHMDYDAIETLGAVARDGGSLWGSGYDLPVAGMLTNGAAYYGRCLWNAGTGKGPSPVETIEAQMRETRYGFGRERRLRLVFTGRRPPMKLVREAARHEDAYLIDAEALLG